MTKKSFLVALLSVLFSLPYSSEAKEKRTDGPPGSEYGDFKNWDGDMSVGAHFGALLTNRSDDDSNFALGLDGDYRPYDVFGLRTTLMLGVSEPRSSFIEFTPIIHGQFSNIKPYALFGPGLGILNEGGTEVKFIVAGGTGADIELTNHWQMGMLWVYHSIFDFADQHSLTARFSYKF